MLTSKLIGTTACKSSYRGFERIEIANHFTKAPAGTYRLVTAYHPRIGDVNIDYIGIFLGVLSIQVAILLAWQIFSNLSTKKDIEKQLFESRNMLSQQEKATNNKYEEYKSKLSQDYKDESNKLKDVVEANADKLKASDVLDKCALYAELAQVYLYLKRTKDFVYIIAELVRNVPAIPDKNADRYLRMTEKLDYCATTILTAKRDEYEYVELEDSVYYKLIKDINSTSFNQLKVALLQIVYTDSVKEIVIQKKKNRAIMSMNNTIKELTSNKDAAKDISLLRQSQKLMRDNNITDDDITKFIQEKPNLFTSNRKYFIKYWKNLYIDKDFKICINQKQGIN